MTSLLAAVLIAAGIGPDLTVIDTVDIIEINYVYDKATGNKRLSQVIFWEFKVYHGSFRVVDYRMLDAVNTRPRYDHRLKRWELTWHDVANKCMRTVLASSFRETQTRYDPEQEDLEEWAISHRRRLTPPR